MSVTPQGTLAEWSFTTTGNREGRVMVEERCHMKIILDICIMHNLHFVFYALHFSNYRPPNKG